MLTGVEELVLFMINSYKSNTLKALFFAYLSRYILVPIYICCTG